MATVFVMGALFEAGRQTSFHLLHTKPLPWTLNAALLTVGLFLMTLNVYGVHGQLSPFIGRP